MPFRSSVLSAATILLFTGSLFGVGANEETTTNYLRRTDNDSNGSSKNRELSFPLSDDDRDLREYFDALHRSRLDAIEFPGDDEEDDRELLDPLLLQYGKTNQLMQCEMTLFGAPSLFARKQQVVVDKVFKYCLNKSFRFSSDEIHFDISQSTWQTMVTIDERRLQEGDVEHRERRLGKAQQSGANIWWGCSSCNRDDPVSDASGRRELSEGPDVPRQEFLNALNCMGSWLKTKKNWHTLTGIGLRCGDHIPECDVTL